MNLLNDKLTDKQHNKTALWHILSFSVPFLVMWIGFILCSVHPFGNMQMLYSDLREQYFPFLQEFQTRLQNGESLLWSWNGGMGTDFISLISYYVASPLNLLTVFFPQSVLRDLLALFLTVKIGCAGLFTSFFLKNVFRKNDFSIVIFSWMYALCSFNMGYYWDVIWMDTVALLPLVILGLYALMTEGKFKLYILSLFFAIISNYYIGVFVCVFCIVAFFSISAIKQIFGKEFLKKALQFGLSSLLAGALSAFLLLHTVLALGYTDSADSATVLSPEFYDSFLEVFGNLLAYNKPTAMEGLPNLYCTILPLLFTPLFLRSKNISLEEKIIHIGILAVIFFSSNFNILDYIFHGFHVPNMLPARYSFIFCFILISIGFRGYQIALEEIKGIDFALIPAFAGAIVGLSCVSLGFNKTIANVVLITAYLLLFFLYFRSFISKKHFTVFLTVLLCGEVISSVVLSMDTVGKTSYTSYPYSQESLTKINENLRENDSTFFRTEMTCRYYLNDGMFYRYAGIGQFSSTANRNVRDLMSGLSFTIGANSYYYNYSTPITNALLGLKYFTSRNYDIIDGAKNEELYESDGFYISQNTAYAGMGFMVEDDLETYEFTNSPFQVQNDLFKQLTGSDENVFIGYQEDDYDDDGFESISKIGSGTYNYTTGSTSARLTVNYTARYTGTYYAYMKIGGGGSISVTTPDDVFSHPVAKLRYITPLCSAKKGDRITVDITCDSKAEDKTISLYFYYLDDNVFETNWPKLTDEIWEPEAVSDTTLSGELKVLKDGLFCSSIPYTKDWHLYVDGTEIEITPLLSDSLIGAHLSEGTHTITMKFIPQGFRAGLLISLSALLVFVLLWVLFPRGFDQNRYYYIRRFYNEQSLSSVK